MSVRRKAAIRMWKASAGHNLAPARAPVGNDDDDDAWETDADFVNDVSEEEQRWGSKTIEGSGRTAGAIEYVLINITISDRELKVWSPTA